MFFVEEVIREDIVAQGNVDRGTKILSPLYSPRTSALINYLQSEFHQAPDDLVPVSPVPVTYLNQKAAELTLSSDLGNVVSYLPDVVDAALVDNHIICQR